MSIKLISLDFDGTIMAYEPPPACFHDGVIALLNDLAPRGVAWCTNSGRDADNQQQVLGVAMERGLRHRPDALLCSESMVFHRSNGAYQALQPWNARVETELKSFHSQVQELLEEKLDDLILRYDSMPVYVGDTYTAFNVPDCANKPVRLFDELRVLLGDLPGLMITRNGSWVAVLIEQVGKGNVLKEYARHAGYGPHEILAIGDQFNDLNMLDGSCARHVGCPASAIPEVISTVRRSGGYVAAADGPEGTIEVIRHFVAL